MRADSVQSKRDRARTGSLAEHCGVESVCTESCSMSQLHPAIAEHDQPNQSSAFAAALIKAKQVVGRIL